MIFQDNTGLWKKEGIFVLLFTKFISFVRRFLQWSYFNKRLSYLYKEIFTPNCMTVQTIVISTKKNTFNRSTKNWVEDEWCVILELHRHFWKTKRCQKVKLRGYVKTFYIFDNAREFQNVKPVQAHITCNNYWYSIIDKDYGKFSNLIAISLIS